MLESECQKKLARASSYPHRKKVKAVVSDKRALNYKRSLSFTAATSRATDVVVLIADKIQKPVYDAHSQLKGRPDITDDVQMERYDDAVVSYDEAIDQLHEEQKPADIDTRSLTEIYVHHKHETALPDNLDCSCSEEALEESSSSTDASSMETAITPPPPPPPPPPMLETLLELSNKSQSEEDVAAHLSNINGESLFADYDDNDDEFYLEEGDASNENCGICYSTFDKGTNLFMFCKTCTYYVCKSCMHHYLKAKITDGFIMLVCPSEFCTRVISDEEVQLYCDAYETLYLKNKVEAENNPRLKTCPGCNKIHNFTEYIEIPAKDKCSSCGLEWCVRCHAPWHVGMTCSKYKKDVVGQGRKALKIWAKCKGKLSANAKKCPTCHFFIERISGCDHICCTRCGTDFCYRCGKKYREAWLFGDHYSRYGFFGCKYNLAKNKPALRVALRSGVFAGSILAMPFAACLLAAVGAVLIAASPVLVPALLIKMRCHHRSCLRPSCSYVDP